MIRLSFKFLNFKNIFGSNLEKVQIELIIWHSIIYWKSSYIGCSNRSDK